MELSKVPSKQLFFIYKSSRDEIRRRFKNNKTQLEISLKAHDELYDIQDDFIYSLNGFLGIPKSTHENEPMGRIKYLKYLLKQNWSHLFKHLEDDGRCDYYVYGHCDPREKKFCGFKDIGGVTPGMPYYIGKGTGNRAYDFKRNEGHGLRIKSLKKNDIDLKETVHFFGRGLTSSQALELEAKLVYFFGTIFEKNVKGVLVNIDKCPRPVFDGYMPKITAVRKDKKNV